MNPGVEIYKPAQILSARNGEELLVWVEQSLVAGKHHFLIDMSNALFMDSTGLGYLLQCLKQIQSVQGQLSLCSLKGQAAMLLELSNIRENFQVFQNASQFNEWYSMGWQEQQAVVF